MATSPTSFGLNPCAQEFVPKAIQQLNQDYPVLGRNKKHMKNVKNLNYAKAVKHREKKIPPKPEPFLKLDPSWIVLKPEDRMKEDEKQEDLPVTETKKSPSPHQTILVSEKPSLGAIDRWKGKWMQIARTVRENLKSQSLQNGSEDHQTLKKNKKNSLWHSALSLPAHLHQVEYQPFQVPDNQQTLDDDDEEEEELYPMSSQFPQSAEDWWLAIQNGDTSKLFDAMSHPAGLDFDWRSSVTQVPFSAGDSSNTKEVKMGPLHAAVYYNQSSSVKLFLDLGPPPPSSSELIFS
jgi:hypothetical protein